MTVLFIQGCAKHITGSVQLGGVAHEASAMYAKNVAAFLLHLVPDGRVRLDLDDEIVAGTLVARDGEVVHPQVLGALEEALEEGKEASR